MVVTSHVKVMMTWMVLFTCIGALGSLQTKSLQLGYLTGSRKKLGDLFYNKPGQSISGAITMAINVSIKLILLKCIVSDIMCCGQNVNSG